MTGVIEVRLTGSPRLRPRIEEMVRAGYLDNDAYRRGELTLTAPGIAYVKRRLSELDRKYLHHTVGREPFQYESTLEEVAEARLRISQEDSDEIIILKELESRHAENEVLKKRRALRNG